MTRVLREYARPAIEVESTDFGLRITALRRLDERRTHCARDQPGVSAGVSRSRCRADDDHASGTFRWTTQLLLVRDLPRPSGSPWTGADAHAAAAALRAAGLPAEAQPRQRVRLRCDRSSAPAPIPAWARTSTCTTSGPWSRRGGSRTAPASTSAPATRRSWPTDGCCCARSTRWAGARRRRWCSTRRRRAVCWPGHRRRHRPGRRCAVDPRLLARRRRTASGGAPWPAPRPAYPPADEGSAPMVAASPAGGATA